ncbi:hypothetical protein OPT61_g799 [Boeremia exigua]|uniref:Uncharacterized protein n=1 Tax=Boeremia exigua TaxID=749465 RepID=A0ACC2ISN5_9PLEO|nr:hypothetical protein OPT61_g799 [Boeremia exigua]
MVYTGKPSRGCGMCKSRRIKCDEKRPTCGNCKKSGRDCPGYPDEFDLVFRDENKAMARKARKTSGPALTRTGADSSSQPSPNQPTLITFEASSTSTSPQEDSSTTQTTPNSDQQLILIPQYPEALSSQGLFDNWLWNLDRVPQSIVLAPDYEPVTFFFKNFITLPQQGESTRGYLEFLVPLYNQASASSVLHLATSAVAMAACGQYPDKQALVGEAVKTYGKAIRKLNTDLKDPVMSKSNETVLAILMFSLYETIMSTDDTITAWGNHVDGAVALTKLRGTDQFNDPMSHAMFRAVRTMMITSCVQRSKPIDPFPGQSGWMGESDIASENAANRLTLICIDLPNLRARANRLTSTLYDPAEEVEARQIVDFALMVDGNLEEWSPRTLPTRRSGLASSTRTTMCRSQAS